MKFSMRLASILALAVLLAASASCTARKITASEAHGFCLASVSFNDGCLDPQLACDTYYGVMQGEYTSAKQCREACLGAGQKMDHKTVTIGCGGMQFPGQGYCAQYCNGAFPQQ